MENQNSPKLAELGILISKESLPIILNQISIEREKKGTSETLIPYIRKVRKEVEKLRETSTVLQLYQEEFLSAQHMVMEEKAKKIRANPLRVVRGIFIMESTSRIIEKYIKEDNEDLDPVIQARGFRFLGRYADYKGQHKESEGYYRKGLEYFDKSTKIEERFNRLEFLGFLSYSLIKQGKNEEGMDIVQQTLKDFDESDEGKWLKENNYYAWAVWKSGIQIRTAEHIIKSKDFKNVDNAKTLLSDAEEILKLPDGSIESFRLRLDELNSTKKLMIKAKI